MRREAARIRFDQADEKVGNVDGSPWIRNQVQQQSLPLDDLGLQRAICLNYFRGRSVSLRTMRKIASVWDPWRSVATWYLWRSLDPIPVEY